MKIRIYPNGTWLWHSELENIDPKREYTLVAVPEFAWEDNIDQFAAFWIQSEQTNECAIDYWKDFVNN